MREDEVPAIPFPEGKIARLSLDLAPNDFQKGLMVAAAHRLGLRGGEKLLSSVHHRQHIAEFFEACKKRHHR